MPKFSVKKPLTIFVCVIAILVLGVVAYTRMTPDLFPNMDFPYIMIMTPYPGASPEKVEEEVTKPLEMAMASLENIKEITSNSNENYAMVMLEFEEGVNLDTIGVDIQQSLTQLSGSWDSMVGNPYMLKINPSIIPVEVAAVAMEGMDNIQMAGFLDRELMTKLEGIEGVARVSSFGEVYREVHVVLDQAKIDQLNRRIQLVINRQLDDAAREVEEKRKDLEEAKEKLAEAREALEEGQDQLISQTAQGEATISQQQATILSTRSDLSDQIMQLTNAKTQSQTLLTALSALQSGLHTIDTESAELRSNIDKLLHLSETAAALQETQERINARIDEIRQSAGLTDEEIAQRIAEIQASPEYQQLQTDLINLQVELAKVQVGGTTLGEIRDNLEKEIAESTQAYDDLTAQRERLQKALSEQNVTEETLQEQISSLNSGISQMDSGLSTLQSTISQLNNGLIQLSDASRVLSEQKASGLLQMAGAQQELSTNAATVESALGQIEEGLKTIESTRKTSLDQANLNSIISLDMASGILTAQNFAMPAGYVEQDGIQYMVSVGDRMTSVEEYENLLLVHLPIDGIPPVYLKDIASVMVRDNSQETYAKLNGTNGILLSFEKQSSYPTAEVTNHIQDRFEALSGQYEGLTFAPLMDQGSYIYIIVNGLLRSLLLGAIFAVIVLIIFLKDIRPTIITLVSIPVSLVFAVVLMYFSNVTINMISLSGLAVAVGMLVDNSIVVIENIYRFRSQGHSAAQAAVMGAKQVMGAVTSSTLTTICVFLPIVFVEGLTKQLFTDLALTMTYSLLASLVIALTLVPAMSSLMLKNYKPHKDWIMGPLIGFYEKVLRLALRYKAVVLILAVVLLVISSAFSISRGFSFMPEADMSSITVNLYFSDDMSMEEATATGDEVMRRALTIEGVETVGMMMSSGGRGLTSAIGGGSGTNDITGYVILKDQNAQGSAVARQIEEMTKDLPGEIRTSSSMIDTNQLITSGVAVEIFADDMEVLQQAASRTGEALQKVEGLRNVRTGLEDAVEAVHISIDRNKAMEKGITVAEVYMALSKALQNEVNATTLEMDNVSVSVIIDIQDAKKLSKDELREFRFEVTNQAGDTLSFPLKTIGTIEDTSSLSTISRINQRRYLTVSAEVEPGYNVTLVSRDVERAVAGIDLGDATYAFSGENEEILDAMGQLMLMLFLGVLLVYFVMVAQFQSLKSPFIVMFTIPLAFTGGFLGLIICGMDVSVVSLIGFIMLMGIIVNNGIVLVDYINQLRDSGMDRVEAIVEAGKTRMRPIFMTSLTTIFGLLDMAISKAAGTTLMKPIAVVCIGGLLFATLMTLLVVPCIYDMLNKKERRVLKDEELQIAEEASV